MRAVRVALLCAMVVVGSAAILFFIIIDRLKKILDRLFNGPDV